MSLHSLNKSDVTWRMVYRMFFLRLIICVLFSLYSKTLKKLKNLKPRIFFISVSEWPVLCTPFLIYWQHCAIQQRRIWTSPAPFLYNQRSCCHEDRTQFGKRAFSVCGPSISNQIPPHIRNLHSAPAFRKALKTYLFLRL